MQSIVVKWGGKDYPLELAEKETVANLKRALQQQTSVDPKRQKLLGLKTKDGKAATDEAVIADLVIKPSTKVLMMGQPEEVIAKTDAEQLAAPEVQVACHSHVTRIACTLLACAWRQNMMLTSASCSTHAQADKLSRMQHWGCLILRAITAP
jgi:hypothetical protein